MAVPVLQILHLLKQTSLYTLGTLLMFPGQGAQKQGMCLSMKESPVARALFERAEKTLGYNILDICLNNNSELEKILKCTEFVQVVLQG